MSGGGVAAKRAADHGDKQTLGEAVKSVRVTRGAVNAVCLHRGLVVVIMAEVADASCRRGRVRIGEEEVDGSREDTGGGWGGMAAVQSMTCPPA